MITYAYHCETCDLNFEVRRSIKDDRSDIRCDCGAVPVQLITGGHCTIVMGVDEYKPNPKRRSGTFRGRDARVEEKQYAKVIEKQRQLVKAHRDAGHEKGDDGWQVEGWMPVPLAHSLAETSGDREAVIKDPIPFLKKTGTYMGTD